MRAFAALILVAMTTALSPSAIASELVPYQATGWKYRQVAWSDGLIALFYSTSYDDGGWSTGQAGFGNTAEAPPPQGCTAALTIHTHWDVATDILLRRSFSALASIPVTIFLSVDNDVVVYVNGVNVLSTTHGGCPLPDDFSIVVPQEILSPSGTNLLAVHVHDRGGFSFADVRIEGELPPVPVETSTWGAVKAIYR